MAAHNACCDGDWEVIKSRIKVVYDAVPVEGGNEV